MTALDTIQHLMSSTPGQFLIGGLTVAGIGYFGNTAANPAIAGVIAAMPIGMPSSIFVKDSKVGGYAWNLLMMSFVLQFVTFTNWYLIVHAGWSKFHSVGMSMLLYLMGSYAYVALRPK